MSRPYNVIFLTRTTASSVLNKGGAVDEEYLDFSKSFGKIPVMDFLRKVYKLKLNP